MTYPFGIDISKAGVYQITNTANGNRYIGSSVHVWIRWKEHTEESKKKMSESLKAHYAEMRGEL